MLDLIEDIGRRDWTRTNDPHHVKVLFAVKSKCVGDYKQVNWFVNSIVKLNKVLQRSLQCEGSACNSTAATLSQWYCNLNRNYSNNGSSMAWFKLRSRNHHKKHHLCDAFFFLTQKIVALRAYGSLFPLSFHWVIARILHGGPLLASQKIDLHDALLNQVR